MTSPHRIVAAGLLVAAVALYVAGPRSLAYVALLAGIGVATLVPAWRDEEARRSREARKRRAR